MKTSKFSEEKIIYFLKQADAGVSPKEICGVAPTKTDHLVCV